MVMTSNDRDTLTRVRHPALIEYMTAMIDGSYAELNPSAHQQLGWTHWPSFPLGFQLVRECRRLNLLPMRQVTIPEALAASGRVLGLEEA